MNQRDADKVIHKLGELANCIRNQNGGDTIHTIGNIRNTIHLLTHQLEEDPECMEDALVNQIVKNVEMKIVEFFKKRYSKK